MIVNFMCKHWTHCHCEMSYPHFPRKENVSLTISISLAINLTKWNVQRIIKYFGNSNSAVSRSQKCLCVNHFKNNVDKHWHNARNQLKDEDVEMGENIFGIVPQ